MISLEEILKSSSLTFSKKERELVEKAYTFAQSAHKNQTRFSGESYFSHLTETAKILALYGMGATTIAAGLLHDTIEDTGIPPKEIEGEFGKEVLFLIEGVTKLGTLKYHGADRHNESLRKLFVAMSEDIRVLMIKLADRLHNMRTLEYVPKEKIERIAGETLEIYAPIAYRLGIRKLSRELEDLGFRYLLPKEYAETERIAKQTYGEQVESLEKFLKSIKKELAKNNITKVRTEYRAKGLYSLYKKLIEKDKNIEKVHDVLAVRIIVPNLDDCYRVLGIIHGSWRPLPGRIKDYIAFPKPNGYQSLHTTVFTGDGNIVEVQIRTEEIHRLNEYGIASHISYKEGSTKRKAPESLSWIGHLLPKKDGNVPGWIKELVEHQKETTESFRNNLKTDFFEHRIFVFTPKGDVVDLPKGSTPVDFAYAIHSEIGDHMTGAKVNKKLASLDEHLHNGDIVEIMTKESAKPSPKWVGYAKTTLAQKHIRSALQKLKEKLK
jgi:guanosine-3',5'-bis(diphosphate) 3'-pyrophosphohydrolase